MRKQIDIGEDNQSCIKMCDNPVTHKRSKHIDTKLHFIRERVENKEVKIHYVPTSNGRNDCGHFNEVITSSESGKTQNNTLRQLRTL